MQIPIEPIKIKDVYDLGYDKSLNRIVVGQKSDTPTAYSPIEQINPALLTSGALIGDVVLGDGGIKTADFSSTASTGWQMTATGYFEANSGVFRGDLSIGSGDNIILADPDDDTWRFGIGNASIASAPFRVDKDGNAYGIGFKTISTFEAGNDIPAGNAVCLRNSYNSALITTAASCNSAAPNNNYGDNEELYVGTSNWTTFLKIPLETIPTNFQKAELVLYSTVYFAENLNIQMCSTDAGTAWTEANLTWNNKPESFFDSDDPGGQYTQAIDSGGITIIDITQMVKLWKNSYEVDFGLKIDVSAPSNAPRFASDDYTVDTDKRPFIRWLTYDESDGKVYNASSGDYNLCRNVIGISTAASTAQTATIQTAGIYSPLSVAVGDRRYLDNVTSGNNNINVNKPAGLPRLVEVGRGIETNKFLIGIKDQNKFIETLGPFNIFASDTRQTVVVHPDACRAVIEYRMNRGTAYEDMGNFNIDIFGDTSVGRKRAISTTSTKESSFDWQSTSQYISIDSQSGASGASDYLTYTIHFYTQ